MTGSRCPVRKGGIGHVYVPVRSVRRPKFATLVNPAIFMVPFEDRMRSSLCCGIRTCKPRRLVTLEHWGSSIDYGLVSAFVESVASGKPVPITGEDGLAAAEVAFAAYESAKRGEPVRLPLPE